MNGSLLVTVADSSNAGSISQREPVAVDGSGTGRNALGNTNAATAAFTGDWSDSR